MHDNEGDQQGKKKIHHPWKPGCSKWCTTWIKEEINPEEANGSHWWRRGCFLQAARRKEKTSKEQTQSNGCRDKCKGSRKKALVKVFSSLNDLDWFQNRLNGITATFISTIRWSILNPSSGHPTNPITYSTTVLHPSKTKFLLAPKKISFLSRI